MVRDAHDRIPETQRQRLNTSRPFLGSDDNLNCHIHFWLLALSFYIQFSHVFQDFLYLYRKIKQANLLQRIKWRRGQQTLLIQSIVKQAVLTGALLIQ